MAQRSSIDRLPPEARDQVNEAIRAGRTLDEIVDLLLDLQRAGMLEEAPSRSAIGRYSQQYRQLAAQQRDMSAVAKAFAGEFGSEDDRQVRMLVQLATSVLTRSAMAVAGAEDGELPGLKDAHYLARAVKDVASAAKIDVDREAKIREEAAKAATRLAADAAESEAKAAGASPETIARVKRRILGLV